MAPRPARSETALPRCSTHSWHQAASHAPLKLQPPLTAPRSACPGAALWWAPAFCCVAAPRLQPRATRRVLPARTTHSHNRMCWSMTGFPACGACMRVLWCGVGRGWWVTLAVRGWYTNGAGCSLDALDVCWGVVVVVVGGRGRSRLPGDVCCMLGMGVLRQRCDGACGNQVLGDSCRLMPFVLGKAV
jgi:hypothetical protein